jgi:hypothetical protein
MTVSWTVDGSSPESVSPTYTEDASLPVLDINNLTIPVTNDDYVWAADVSQIKFIVITANYDCTLKANSSGSPAYTLTLKANKPLLWWTDCGYSNLLTTDTTVLYLTAADTATDFNLTIRGVYDPTP